MSTLRGRGGALRYKAEGGVFAAVKVMSWTINLTKEELDDTALGDTFQSFVGGLIGGTFTAEVKYDPAVPGSIEIGDRVLEVDDPGTDEVELIVNTLSGEKYTGLCLITSVSLPVNVQGLIQVTVSGRLNPPVTHIRGN